MEKADNKYNWLKIYDSAEEAVSKVPVRKAQQLQVEGRTICLAHTQKGFFAVDDACPHLGYSLSRGTTNYLNEVVCPWHSYRYNLENGRECEYRTRSAVTYPVEIRADGVYIGLPLQIQP